MESDGENIWGEIHCQVTLILYHTPALAAKLR